MSLSINDILQIINTIKSSVETCHANNAICKELARISCRLGSFLEANVQSIEYKLNDKSVKLYYIIKLSINTSILFSLDGE